MQMIKISSKFTNYLNVQLNISFLNLKKNRKRLKEEGGCYLQKFERERIGQFLHCVGCVHCLIEDGRQVVGVLDEDHHPGDALVQTVRRHQSQVVLGVVFFYGPNQRGKV